MNLLLELQVVIEEHNKEIKMMIVDFSAHN